MSWRVGAGVLLLASLPAGGLLGGCGDSGSALSISDQKKPAPTATTAATGSAAEAQAQAAQAGTGENEESIKFMQEESSTYRDPFRSFLLDIEKPTAGTTTEESPRSPTEMYAVGEFRVIGIITGTPVPKAMVVDPTGFGHVIRPGDRIGKQGARVVGIYANQVVIRNPPPGEEETVVNLNPKEQEAENYGVTVVESPIETQMKKSAAQRPGTSLDLRQLLGVPQAEQGGTAAREGAAGGAPGGNADLPPIPVIPLLPMMQPGPTAGPATVATPGNAGATPPPANAGGEAGRAQ